MSQPPVVPIAQGLHSDVLLSADGRWQTKVDTEDANVSTEAKVLAQAARRTVLKLVTAPKSGAPKSRRPHDVVREVRVLERMHHRNIVRLLGYSFDAARMEHKLTLPLLALKLSEVLTSTVSCTHPEELFAHTAAGIFAGLAHLHASGLAHRDIKPANIMFGFDGTPILIDFGTAWDGDRRADGGTMSCAVGTQQYRAPELLFSPVKYDARAVDLWSAGVTLAEFFRPRGGKPKAPPSDSDDSDDSEFSKRATAKPPPKSVPDPSDLEKSFAHLNVDVAPIPPTPLFSAAFGELGLAASIFRLLGTPTDTTWPSFSSLPDAGKISFDPHDARDIRDELDGPPEMGDILEGLVRLEPAARTDADSALGKVSKLPQLGRYTPALLQPLLVGVAKTRTTV